ncbi:MAG TPA: gluconate 2-dehydrogenase subunit 3 family protein [Vicinamibacterales bacterium]|jgi:gluconate 2-dehydrogenase gamma chain|nr:gluconate 2-dehydrogenase subunit 3 family protein [Vicinamibacterales bacterium]
MTFISRRDLLKRAAAVGAAAAIPVDAVPVARSLRASEERSAEAVALQAIKREPLENLTASEMDALDAIVARLIPTDANGPGATEARAAHYIDRALGGALAASRPAYTTGLAALDRYARASRGAPFTELSPSDQDAVLVDVEKGAATGFTGSSAAFFGMVLNHTHQGTFGDPYYGGNVNFVGWDLIGYPGVRTMVTPTDQKRLESKTLKTDHKSAYEYDFNKDTERGRGPASIKNDD